MTHRPAHPTRRRLLAAAGAALWVPGAARARNTEPPVGWVLPRPAPPAWPLALAGGGRASLQQLVQGRLTAVQLMFTGCTTSCSLQGLHFAQAAARARRVPVQWLSISIDALGDDAARLQAWQQRFGPHPSWRAAVPTPRDVDALAGFLRGVDSSGTHTEQVFVFDRAGRLAWRSGDQPGDELLERLFEALA